MRIAVTGCGPAGLAAALILDKQGHNVTLLERFAEPRPVGSGIILQPTGLAVLRGLGLEQDIHSLGKRIDRMTGIVMPAGKRVLNVNYRSLGDDSHGLALHRAALFDVLYAAVLEREITVRTGVEISTAQQNSDAIVALDVPGNSHGSYDLLVDASGSGSKLQGCSDHPPRRFEFAYGAIWGAFEWPGANFEDNVLEQRYVGAHTMIGVLPIGQHSGVSSDQVAFFWSLKAANYDAWVAAGIDVWKRQVRSIWPQTDAILEQITDASQMSPAKYSHSTMRKPYGNRIVFIGDAAHASSPQLGQGANMALLDAWALGTAMRETTEVTKALQAYAASRCWHVRAFQLASLALTPFYQSDSRLLAGVRDLLFDPVAKLPVARRIVAGLIAGTLGNPYRKLGLART